MQKFDRSIVDGPLAAAVWKLAWPTMLQNVIAGLQGIIDHAMVGLAFMAVPSVLLGVFGMRDAHVLEIGTELLQYLTVSGFFVTVALVYNGALQGTGDTTSPFYISLVSQIVVPLGFCAVMNALHGLRASDIWTAIVIGHVLRCTLGVLRFRQGKWRQITVEIAAPRAGA